MQYFRAKEYDFYENEYSEKFSKFYQNFTIYMHSWNVAIN